MAIFDFFKRKNTTSERTAGDDLVDSLDMEIKALSSFDPVIGGGGSTSAENLSLMPGDLQRLYISDSWIYAAINALSSTVSDIPLKTKSKTMTNGKSTYEFDEDTELQGLISFPNPYCSWAELVSLQVVDLMTVGECFLYLEGAGRGQYKLPKAIYRLNPTTIEPLTSDKGPYIDSYVMISEHGQTKFSPKEILHIRMPNPFSSVRGLSPLVPAFQNIKLDRLITENDVNFYQKGARLGGVLTHPKNLSKAQLNAIQRSFESNYTGHKNGHRTLILPTGMDYKTIASTSSDAQTLEKAKYNRDSIISVLKVPPIKLGFLEQASYSNAEIQEKFYYTDTIKPLLRLIQDSYNLHGFITPPDRSVILCFDLSEVTALREDFEMLAKTAETMLRGGLTVNEVRELIWKKEPLTIPHSDDTLPTAQIENLQSSKSAPAEMDEELEEEQDEQVEESQEDEEQKSVETKDLPSNDMANISRDVIDSRATIAERIAQLAAMMIQQGLSPSDAVHAAARQALTEYSGTPAVEPEKEQPAVLGKPSPSVSEAEVMAQPETHSHVMSINGESYKTSEDTGGAEHTHSISYNGKSLISSPPIATIDGHKHTYELPEHDEDEDMWKNIAPEKKEVMIGHHKDFLDKTDKLISEREKELGEFFAGYEEIVLKGIKKLSKQLTKPMKTKADEDELAGLMSVKELNEFIDTWIKKNHPSMVESVNQGYNNTLPNISIDFKLTDPIADALIRAIELDQVTLYDETTRKQLASVLKEQYAQGSTITQIGQAISAKFAEISVGRAMTIARTEILSAYTQAEELRQDEIQKAFPDQKIRRTWITMQDPQVRHGGKHSKANHVKLHGVEKIRGEKFNDNLSELEYPRDRKGAAGSVINCRCTLLKELVSKE